MIRSAGAASAASSQFDPLARRRRRQLLDRRDRQRSAGAANFAHQYLAFPGVRGKEIASRTLESPVT